jgi:hypothetical protein
MGLFGFVTVQQKVGKSGRSNEMIAPGELPRGAPRLKNPTRFLQFDDKSGSVECYPSYV